MINKTSFSYHICSIVVSAKATTNLYNKKVQLFKYIHSYVLACLSTYFLLTYNSKLERGLITPQNIAFVYPRTVIKNTRPLKLEQLCKTNIKYKIRPAFQKGLDFLKQNSYHRSSSGIRGKT